MKYIRKGKEPNYLTQYRNKVCNSWVDKAQKIRMTPKQGYEASDMPKAQLLETLIEEQGSICCYCMRRISKSSKHLPHIEHYLPQSSHPKLALDYKNLLAVCQGEYSDKSGNKDWHCDHRKANGLLRFLNPLNENCEQVLQYTNEGRIKSDRADVKQDIDLLNLNSDALKKERKKAIEATLNAIGRRFKGSTVTKLFIKDRIEKFASRNEDGYFEPYCQAIIFILQKMLSRAK